MIIDVSWHRSGHAIRFPEHRGGISIKTTLHPKIVNIRRDSLQLFKFPQTPVQGIKTPSCTSVEQHPMQRQGRGPKRTRSRYLGVPRP